MSCHCGFKTAPNNIYPISFSIPKCKIINFIPHKTRMNAPMIPGKKNTYIYDNETDYYNQYKESYFGITCKKSGWDCLRHYEILANGCIPIFLDLNKCPTHTMYHFPKKILYEIYSLPKTEVILNYDYHVNNLLEYTRKYLTTEAMANYILHSINKKDAKKILFLSGLTEYAISPDYLRCLTLHGFKEILLDNCHDYPKITHLYNDYKKDYTKIYGKGITYSGLLDSNIHRNNNLDKQIPNDIINHNYDIIIYGSIHRGKPFFDLVNKYYKPNEIVILCCADSRDCSDECDHSEINLAKSGYNVFIREL